jgi:hypothetical protein
MEQHPTMPPLIRFEERPGEPFDVLQVNVPLPRTLISSPAAEHFGAAGREFALAVQALVEQFVKRAHDAGIGASPSGPPIEIPAVGSAR